MPRKMCGRFVQAQSAQSYAGHFGAVVSLDEALDPSWNVAPTDRVYAVAEHEDKRILGAFRWGLIPWFAKEAKVGARHINARVESVATTPAFKDSFARRRCVIPADGFYEWEKRESGGKLPHFVHHADRTPLALAGLWASWQGPNGERIVTCSILTTRPNDLVAPIHDRMPVILPRVAWNRWLDRETTDPGVLTELLVAAEPRTLAEYPVSTLVNDVKNNHPECAAPLR